MSIVKVDMEKIRPVQWIKYLIPRLLALVIVLNGILYILTTMLASVDDSFFLKAVHDADYVLNATTTRHLSGLVGLFFGFYLIIIGKGLFHRYRRSWWMAVITLTLLIFNSFTLTAIPALGYLSIGLLVFMLASYRLFPEHPPYALMSYQKIVAWLSILLAVAYSVLGCYMLRSEFNNLKTWTDAVYFTFVTFSTVGYGDISPITQNAKYFTVSIIVIGLGSFATALSFIIGPMIELRMKGVMNIMKKVTDLSNHVILCGYTAVSKALIADLEKDEIPFVFIEKRADAVLELQNLGYKIIPGTSSQTASFEQARLEKATAVICAYDDDADNILAILTINGLLQTHPNNKLKIMARIEHEENIDKVKSLNVDHIVSPATMAAQALMDVYNA